MLTRVRFENVKALADATIPLQRLTVLVGANGCGKSTALEGLRWIATCATSEHAFWNKREAWDPRRWTTAGSEHVSVTLHFDRGPVDVGVTLARQTDGGSRFEFSEAEQGTTMKRQGGKVGGEPVQKALQHVDPFHGQVVRLLQLSIPALRRASVARERRPRMEPDGSGLGAVLGHLAKADRDAFDALERDLRAVVPQVERLAVESAEMEGMSVFGEIAAVDIHDMGRILAPDLSEGTLLTLALLAELHSPGAPDVLLLDDIDRGLHPRAQADLLRCLRSLMERRPGLQIVATSHSPYLLDHLEPEEVVVMALDERSRAHARRLAEHPDWPRMRDLLRTGEFWASVGEDWVVQGVGEQPDAA